MCRSPEERGFMFTGIITETGTVTRITRERIAFRARRSFTQRLRTGASVAVDGVCLTVVRKGGGSFIADMMSETAKRTTLGKSRQGDSVNLELPATLSSFLSGHLVQGHVDGVGVVRDVVTDGESSVLAIAAPAVLRGLIVEKGSIAVDGVSLTVIELHGARLSVGIVPHTRKATTLGAVKRGDRVNIEVDILAKYVKKLLQKESL